MSAFLRTAHAAVLASMIALAPKGASAQAPDQRARAAAAFDQAVAKFDRAEFAEAARGFLEADRLAPSAVAITNAIAAARRANEHLLVARAAQRAIARGEALVEARAALAEAATRLARLELSCDVAPCEIAIDGERAASASEYVIAGVHRVEARSGAASAEERVVCVAGAAYRVALHPAAKVPDAPAKEPARATLPKPVFFVGLGVTAALVGLTIWSGADAIASKDALGATITQAQKDDVLGRARRTDWLLLGAGVAGIGTAVIGAFFTSFRAPSPPLAVVPTRGGAALVAAGRFW